MSITHIPGFPRIGLQRELKTALERHWQGQLDEAGLRQIGRELRARHWAQQKQAGLDFVTVGDFAWYDQVLTHTALFGAWPARFGFGEGCGLAEYFQLARGNAAQPALELTKWFDTNYHYLVLELSADTRLQLDPQWLLPEVDEALALGHRVKPVLIGPLSWLWLAKAVSPGFERLSLLPRLVEVYAELLGQLRERGIEWVQIDEPALTLDLPESWLAELPGLYSRLVRGAPQLLLATYFGSVAVHADRLMRLPVSGLHLDLVRAPEQIGSFLPRWPQDKILSAGCIDGRNIWRANLPQLLERLHPLRAQLGSRLWLAPSCSLLHVPVDLQQEQGLAPEIRQWLAFAVQKLDEVVTLARALSQGEASVWRQLSASAVAAEARKQSPLIHRPAVKARLATLTAQDSQRPRPFAERAALQREQLCLPLLPTTTIGSFPQTAAIRASRAAYRAGRLPETEYREAMRAEIRDAVARQEALGLDVLVHGEPERTDMVEYFGEQLAGYFVTRNGWVQSYGSRCVKPPVILGDIERVAPMTVEWSAYAQSLTAKPMKGMLTGPVTMLQWSFVRDDQPREQTALQLALAIRDEVTDLEAAGIHVIQIDEPAFREGLPLRRADWAAYLEWAARAFRLSSAGVRDATQIHTHMCYAEFNDVLDGIVAMDADVITIETSRSHMELLGGADGFHYPNDIGPGVYDIHSPRVPPVEEMTRLIDKALTLLPAERVWINPDCGCKTRGWAETEAALRHMVEAAGRARARLGDAVSAG